MKAIAFATCCAAASAMTYSDTNYVSLLADSKMKQLWQAIIKNETSNEWTDTFAAFLAEDMNVTFDAPGDEMPGSKADGYRTKVFHGVGVVGKAKFVADNDRYSGLFQGADNVVVRLSLASPPVAGNIVPSLALKFLRDGMDSVNM